MRRRKVVPLISHICNAVGDEVRQQRGKLQWTGTGNACCSWVRHDDQIGK